LKSPSASWRNGCIREAIEMSRLPVLLLSLGLWLSPSAAFATQEVVGTETAASHLPPGAVHAPDAAVAAEKLRAVLDGPDFARREESWQLRFRHDWLRDWFSRKQDASTDPAKGALFSAFGELFVWMVNHALWLLALLVLILAYRYRRRWLGLLQRLPRATADVPQAVIREDRESVAQPLPDDVAAAAEVCWRNGQPRQALSLLYRGAVAALALPAPATERENLRLVRAAQTPEMVEAFTRIARAWQALAWAHQPPGSFEALLETYRRYFRQGGAP
jgi:hypothetical protein